MASGNKSFHNWIKPITRLLLVGVETQLSDGLRVALPKPTFELYQAAPDDDISAIVQSVHINALLVDRDRYGSGVMLMIDQVNTVAPWASIILLAENPILVEMITAVKLHVADIILKPTTIAEIVVGIQKFQPRYNAPVVLPPVDLFGEGGMPAKRVPPSANIVVVRSLTLNCRMRTLTDRAQSAELVRLSPKETAILAALMRQVGQVVSCRQLAAAAWTKDLPESDVGKSVRPYISRLRKKLKTRLQLDSVIVTVDHQGYVFSAGNLPDTI